MASNRGKLFPHLELVAISSGDVLIAPGLQYQLEIGDRLVARTMPIK